MSDTFFDDPTTSLSLRQIALRDGEAPRSDAARQRRQERIAATEKAAADADDLATDLMRVHEHVRSAPVVHRDTIRIACVLIERGKEQAQEEARRLRNEARQLRNAS